MIDTKGKGKSLIAFMMMCILLFLSFVPSYVSYATEDDGGKSEILDNLNKEMDKMDEETYGKDKDIPQVTSYIAEQDSWLKPQRANTFRYVFYRAVMPNYLNDLSKGVFGSDPTVDTSVRGSDGHVCFPTEPQNLLNHNCDIPTPSAEFGQKVYTLFYNGGISGGETRTAKTNLGIPVGIEDKGVPVNPSERTQKYTALELFGYDVGYTMYRGEVDNIQVSSQARQLTNFGFFDKINLTGQTIFNGVKGGLTQFITGFSFNPLKVFHKIIDFGEGFVSGALLTILDTHDLNVVATHSWGRPDFAGTVYNNIYYMSDKIVIEKAIQDYTEKFMGELESRMEAHPEFQFLLSIQFSKFSNFDPNAKVETDASKKARAKVQEYNKGKPKKKQKDMPAKVYKTEEELWQDWLKESNNADIIKKGEGAGFNVDKTSYAKFKTTWIESWGNQMKAKAQDAGKIMEEIYNYMSGDYFKENPFTNPATELSHWVYLPPGVKPTKENFLSSPQLKYVYKGFNTPTSENRTPGVPKSRPPIKGSVFGTGDYSKSSSIPDTRYQTYLNFKEMPEESLGFTGATLPMKWASFNTKIANEILTLSFTNIIKALQIDKMLNTTIETLRDSLFFPLMTSAIAISAVFLMLQLLATRSLRKVFTGVGLILLIAFLGTALMYKPGNLLKITDEIPNKIDNWISEALQFNQPNGICSADSDDEHKSIRELQCGLWQVTTFNPWVYGQFGRSPEECDVNEFANTKANEELVGTADVNMGANYIEHNWALYQLSQMKSGTITNSDNNRIESHTSPNLYRLVDLQAGPEGSGYDNRTFNYWTGYNDSGRSLNGFCGWILSIFAIKTFWQMGIVKIETSLLMALMLFILPIIMLIGLLPKGGSTVKKYFTELINLFLKRTAVVVVLLFTINLCTSTTQLYKGNSYFPVFLLNFITLLVMEKFWNQFIEWLSTSGHKFSFDAIKGKSPVPIPPAVRNRMVQARSRMKGEAVGTITGAVWGLANINKAQRLGLAENPGQFMEKAINTARATTTGRELKKTKVKQKRAGYGTFDEAQQAIQATKQQATSGYTHDGHVTKQSQALVLLENNENFMAYIQNGEQHQIGYGNTTHISNDIVATNPKLARALSDVANVLEGETGDLSKEENRKIVQEKVDYAVSVAIEVDQKMVKRKNKADAKMEDKPNMMGRILHTKWDNDGKKLEARMNQSAGGMPVDEEAKEKAIETSKSRGRKIYEVIEKTTTNVIDKREQEKEQIINESTLDNLYKDPKPSVNYREEAFKLQQANIRKQKELARKTVQANMEINERIHGMWETNPENKTNGSSYYRHMRNRYKQQEERNKYKNVYEDMKNKTNTNKED